MVVERTRKRSGLAFVGLLVDRHACLLDGDGSGLAVCLWSGQARQTPARWQLKGDLPCHEVAVARCLRLFPGKHLLAGLLFDLEASAAVDCQGAEPSGLA